MPSDLKEFFREALYQPSDYVPYFVSTKLREMYPDATILETESWAFDLAEYAEAGHCMIWPREPILCQQQMQWRGAEEPFEIEIENAWWSVLWPNEGRERYIDVLYITWNDAGCETTRKWIIAESEALATAFLRAVCAWCDETHGEILVYEDGGWEKDEKLFASIRSATFENLILPSELKSELREDFRRFFAARELYREYGIPWKRGVLLIGPPGNGKTHAIKALANELNLPCLYVKSFKSDRGSEQGNMRRVFQRARRAAPCLVVLEDLDALIEEENRSFLLNELDGFASNEGVVVIASTNHPEKLDTAILDRPSRFDRKYHFTLPALRERRAYFDYWNRTLQPALRMTETDLAALAESTEGFSFAYLKELVLSGMMAWMGNQISESSSRRMGEIIRERAALLREQLQTAQEGPAKSAAAVGAGRT